MWPMGTIFKTKSRFGEETWKVDAKSDVKNGIISSESPLGTLLLKGKQDKIVVFEKMAYEIIGIQVPEGMSNPPQPKMFVEITGKIAQGQTVRPVELKWLEDHKYFSTLAEYNESQYKIIRKTTYAIQACKFWRKAGNPERGIEITENIVDKEPRSMAVLLTTRGGAFRDLEKLNEARRCATKAIELAPSSYYPYCLLGAIYQDAGRSDEAHEYFEKGKELGAPLRDGNIDFW